MSAWELPTSLEIGGVVFNIRTDFRVILDCIRFLNDSTYTREEQWAICVDIIYGDYEKIPEKDFKEACEKALWFINMGDPESHNDKPVMDWEQDADMIIPAVNAVAGKEIRLEPYIHWWTFMGWYMSIHEGFYTQVLSIRSKRNKHKKLETWEKEFYAEHKKQIDLKHALSAEEQAEKDAVDALFG